MAEFISYLGTNHPNPVSIICTFLSTFVYSCITLFINLIPTVPTFQLVLTMNLFLFCLLYPSALKVKFPTYKDSNSLTALLIFRCVISLATTVCWFIGALYTSLAETEIIYNLGIFWTTLYALFITKSRKFSLKIVLIFLFLLSGLLCIGISKSGNQNIQDPSKRYYGITLLLLGSFFNSLIEICQNKLSQVHQMETNNIIVTICVVGIMGSSLISIFSSSEKLIIMSYREYFIILVISIFFVIGLYSYSLAFKLGEISTVSILQLLTLIWGFLFDIYYFNRNLNIYTIFGAVLISTGILINLFEKKKN